MLAAKIIGGMITIFVLGIAASWVPFVFGREGPLWGRIVGSLLILGILGGFGFLWWLLLSGRVVVG